MLNSVSVLSLAIFNVDYWTVLPNLRGAFTLHVNSFFLHSLKRTQTQHMLTGIYMYAQYIQINAWMSCAICRCVCIHIHTHTHTHVLHI
uniref:Uncharacterized protein n=1 Tax=Anguilla anguilla TaxID=7936 RepID=A0A0E9RHX2_ANGAN